MKLRRLLLSSVVVVPAVPFALGGWAVATVENPPTSLTAGVPFKLEYTVRQHGVEKIGGLKGTVEAVARGRKLEFNATSDRNAGRYFATVTIPETGDWTISIRHGFGNGKTTMLPIKVLAAGSAPVVMAAEERGRHLFAAKGCVTCHVEEKVAPDPRTLTYNEAFVKKLLADPGSVPSRRSSDMKMPQLDLSESEIAALTSYLAGPNSTGTR
jgi:hypothetical protein